MSHVLVILACYKVPFTNTFSHEMCKIYIVSKDFGDEDLKMKIHSSWSQNLESGIAEA